jgi:putative hydrolase of HD superfamily
METMSEQTEAAEQLLRFLDRAGRLESLPRTGWLVAGIQAPESVAAHSWEVTLAALWLADRVEREVDAERVMRVALLHDIGEALLTDLPRSVKELVGGEAVAEAESEATQTILESVGKEWVEAAEAYRRQETPEARLVKAADRIQMLAKSLAYESQRRGDVDQFWEDPQEAGADEFPLVDAIYTRLRERWEAGEWYDNELD